MVKVVRDVADLARIRPFKILVLLSPEKQLVFGRLQ